MSNLRCVPTASVGPGSRSGWGTRLSFTNQRLICTITAPHNPRPPCHSTKEAAGPTAQRLFASPVLFAAGEKFFCARVRNVCVGSKKSQIHKEGEFISNTRFLHHIADGACNPCNRNGYGIFKGSIFLSKSHICITVCVTNLVHIFLTFIAHTQPTVRPAYPPHSASAPCPNAHIHS